MTMAEEPTSAKDGSENNNANTESAPDSNATYAAPEPPLSTEFIEVPSKKLDKMTLENQDTATAVNAIQIGDIKGTHEPKDTTLNSQVLTNMASESVEGKRVDVGITTLPGPTAKKKKSKSKGSKGLGKGTGFEEFFADAPLTPAQAQENVELYTASKPVDERIQTAVQRFCARRKFDSASKEVFDRYLVFGGIDAGPNMFGGGDPDADDLTAEEIAALKNTKFLNEAVLNGDMVVDFDGVLKAYLSSYSAMWFTPEPEAEIKHRVNVIRSFLNYLLYHDVCPEYRDEIDAAKRTCDIGEAQLWLVGECGRKMPGDFNIACSLLFHGWYYGCYMPSSGDESNEVAKRRIAEAQAAIRAAMACHASDEACKRYIDDTRLRKKQPVRKFRTGLEVVRVEFADEEKRQVYAMPIFKGCKVTGKMIACTWHNPASLEPDLAEEEELVQVKPKIYTYEFWVEEEILAKVFRGLKFEADVYELTFGVYFFDSPANFRCSFFSWIPNEPMIGWREHVYLPPRESYAEPELQVTGG